MSGLLLAGCSGSGEEAAAEDQLSAQPADGDVCAIGDTTDVDPRKSLYVTDQAILSGTEDFSLGRTLDQLAAQSGDPNLTGEALFRQWWDTQNAAPGFGPGPHCETTLNGYAHQCPRGAEGAQADPNVSAQHLASYTPIALVNRFDLAPVTGENCGEYRIIYGKTSFGIRNLPIFEAKLPNPNPGCGLQACRPVQELWARLSSIRDPARRARLLAKFYYEGYRGFEPVVSISHYTGPGTAGPYGSGDSGQIRSNQFMQGPWNLREFNLVRRANEDGTASLGFEAVTVKGNPFGELFNGSLPGTTHPLARKAARFQRHFLTQVDTLAINDLNAFHYDVSNVFNPGESQMFGSGPTDYLAQFNADGGSSPFRTELSNLAADHGLIADDIVNRAMALSCGGCHQESAGRNLGAGLVWPQSLGFVQGSEFSTEPGPDGPRFLISPALENVFLPARERVMEGFLTQTTCVECAAPLPVEEIRPADATGDTIGGRDSVH